MQYLVWSDGTKLPITDVVVVDDEIAFTIQALPKPLAKCFVFDDDGGKNQTAHGIVSKSVHVDVDQNRRTCVKAILTNQTMQMTSEPAQPAGPEIDPNKAYSRKEIAVLLNATEKDVQKFWDNWDAQSGHRMNYTKQTGRGPARVSTGRHIQQYLNTYRGTS